MPEIEDCGCEEKVVMINVYVISLERETINVEIEDCSTVAQVLKKAGIEDNEEYEYEIDGEEVFLEDEVYDGETLTVF